MSAERPKTQLRRFDDLPTILRGEDEDAAGDIGRATPAAPEQRMELPDIELVAAAVHEAWMDQKRAKGITSAPSQATGEEQMRPYAELSHEVQEYDRATVRAVYDAIRQAMPDRAAVRAPSGEGRESDLRAEVTRLQRARVGDSEAIGRLMCEVERLQAEVGRPSQGWQPIETCSVTSKPGEERRRILTYGLQTGCQVGYVIDYGDGTRFVAAEGFHGDWKITHWMPLPAPPGSEDGPPRELDPDEPDVHLLAWAVSNCHTLARRELNRQKPGVAHDSVAAERWAHILRICEKAGARSQGVLRASVPREMTEGAGAGAVPPPEEPR